MTLGIVLVDDEEADQIRFKRAAKKAGLARPIRAFKSGADALKQLEQDCIRGGAAPECVLITDLKMPVMTGIELVSKLRDDPALGRVPTFVLSSSDVASDVAAAMESGADGYLLKGAAEADLVEIISWLERYCAQIEKGEGVSAAQDGAERPRCILAGPLH